MSQNTTLRLHQQQTNYCVWPLVPSTHLNPIQLYSNKTSECALSCDAGSKIYGLSPTQQRAVNFVTLIGTILCLLGLIILSLNLYCDSKTSKERFTQKPILFHIPYIITVSTFSLTLLMSISLIIGKDSVICFEGELTVWNPGDGRSPSCSIFSVFFYSSLMYYEIYVLLLSFIVWRQFKSPLSPLWDIKDRYWHLAVFLIVLSLNAVSLLTASIDAIEPMGVCLPGPADKMQLFQFVVLPLLSSWVLSAVFLIWSALLVKRNIDKNKGTINAGATVKMVDLFQRILVYGFGVLFTLGLLNVTGWAFWFKHDRIRDGLREWINCELTNQFIPDIYGLDKDCDGLRTLDQTISPFYFMSWIISCLMAICAQLILSFHINARKRANQLKEKTFLKIVSAASPRLSKIRTRLSRTIKHDQVHSNVSEYDSAATITNTPNTGVVQLQSVGSSDDPNVSMIQSEESPISPQLPKEVTPE